MKKTSVIQRVGTSIEAGLMGHPCINTERLNVDDLRALLRLARAAVRLASGNHVDGFDLEHRRVAVCRAVERVTKKT